MTDAWDGLPPLVGRDQEMDVVTRVLEASRRHRPTVVQVVGEPGLGKTRLLGEICERAESQGLLVLRGVGEGYRSGRVFGSLAEPFAAYVADEGVSGRAGSTSAHDDDLHRLAGLGDSESGAPDDISARAASDLTRRVLSRLARHRAVLVALDDVQWADEGTLDVLTSLTRHPPRGGVVVVLCYRPLPTMRAFADARPGRIEGPVVGALHRFELAALTEQQLAELIPDATPARRRALYEACGGNPFFVQSVHAGAADIVAGSLERDGLPAAVHNVLAAELDALDPMARRVADTAAVVGGPVDPDLVAQVAELPMSDVLDALDVLSARTICRQLGPGRWQFRHPLLARAVYDAQPAASRFRAHQAAAAELARRGAPLAEQARHLAVASPRGDLDAARTLALAADQLAGRAPAQAASWYSAALDIAPQTERRWREEVDLAQARVLVAIGRVDDAQAILHHFLAVAEAHDPERVAVTALAARVAYLLGHHDEAEAILQRELASAVPWDPGALAALYVELATARLMSADFAGAREAAERALQLAPDSDPPTVAGAAAALTLSCAASGDLTLALSHRETAARLVDGLSDGELAGALAVGVFLGWAEMFLEHVEASRRHLERCLRIARRGAHQHLLTHLLVGWGSVLKIVGDLAGATEAYDEAREAGERVGSSELATMATAMQCRAATWRGDGAAAERLGAEAVARAAERSTWFASVAGALLAQARLLAGNPTGCVEAILRAGGGPDLPGFDPASRCDWWEAAVTAAVLDGDLTAARDMSIRSRACAAGLPLRSPLGFAALGEARIRLATDDVEGAAEQAAEAGRHFTAIGHRLEAARARYLEGLARGRLGERTQALALLTEAEAVFATCRAARMRAEARSELRRLGRRVATVDAGGSTRGEDADATSLPSLSPRERQVAALVAAGMTNRQIAGDLVVSEKTVESHLAHIFVKLDVSSRAAVASVVAGAGAGA